jgi:hypothetical protein
VKRDLILNGLDQAAGKLPTEMLKVAVHTHPTLSKGRFTLQCSAEPAK